MKSKNILLLTLTALIFLPSVEAEEKKKLYKWVDERGNVFYSDEPQKGAEEVKLPEVPAIKMKLPKAIKPFDDEVSDPNSSLQGYKALNITSPETSGVVRNNASEVSITANVEPSLKNGHQLRFFLDGKPFETTTSLTATAKKVEYGNHTASVIIVDNTGKTIEESKSVSFTLLHVINPNRRK